MNGTTHDFVKLVVDFSQPDVLCHRLGNERKGSFMYVAVLMLLSFLTRIFCSRYPGAQLREICQRYPVDAILLDAGEFAGTGAI